MQEIVVQKLFCASFHCKLLKTITLHQFMLSLKYSQGFGLEAQMYMQG